MKVEGKANIHNRFTFEVEHIHTGKVEIYKAENIVLDACFTRLVNFQTYFTHIHVGTGTGALDATRTQLFTPIDDPAAKQGAATVLTERLLPTSRWQRRVIIDPEDLDGEVLTEVGIGYSAADTNLCTHALIEDSEGAPISLTKTDEMVVTIYADVFIQLGAIDAMYGGKWRWVHPLANNQLLSYLVGASYPTQQFRVSEVPDFSPVGHEGCAPGSHGQSANITTSDWTPNAGDKKTVTPEERLGISVGNGEIRCFGLGSSNTLGTFRGQFPITDVFTTHAIDEQIGVGDDAETGFNLSWNDPSSLVIKNDDVVVDAANYTVSGVRENTNLFIFKPVVSVDASLGNPHYLTDGDTTTSEPISNTSVAGIDVGTEYATVDIKTFRVTRSGTYSRTIYLHGSDNADFSGSVLIAEHTGYGSVTVDVSISPAVSYRYYTISANSAGVNVHQVSILSTDDQIVFNTAPGIGEIITAEYNVDYIPKDTDHVLDLQCAIQYGEG